MSISMNIIDTIKSIAKEAGYVLAHKDDMRGVYIYRDRNITTTIKLDIDKIEMYYHGHGEAETIEWLRRKFG